MGRLAPSCIFCTRVASFGPFEGSHICFGCAKRISALAQAADVRALTRIWSIAGAAGNEVPIEPAPIGAAAAPVMDEDAFEDFRRGVQAQIAADDVDSHVHLAVAYREMALYDDAVREAGVALSKARDEASSRTALTLLLSAPLLRPSGFEALRSRLIAN